MSTFEEVKLDRELRKLERHAQKSTIPITGRILGILVDVHYNDDKGFSYGIFVRGQDCKVGEWLTFDNRERFIYEFFNYLDVIEKRRIWHATNKIIPDYDVCK